MRIFLLLALAALVACNGEPPQVAPEAETAPLSDLDRAFLEELAAEIRAWAQAELDEIRELVHAELGAGVEEPLDGTRAGLAEHLEAGVDLTETAAGRADANPNVTALARNSNEQHHVFAERVRDEDG